MNGLFENNLNRVFFEGFLRGVWMDVDGRAMLKDNYY